MAVEKLKVKAAWQLYASVSDVSPSDANQISKYIDEYETKLKHADDDEKEDIHVEDFIPLNYIEIFKKSIDYRQITINLKCHACGMMLLDGDIRREIGLISALSKTSGKRTLCACIEGKALDDYGFVKEDFLIVDAVSLTHEFFEAIGEDVPSYEKLKELVENDKPTWDIYAKGITCCVNQCEKEATIQKIKKYKPQNIAELSAFIAGIRPGFAPLLNVFLNRELYTTGEPKIDALLESSSHFMIYQEGIMIVLNYLGLEMGETYKVIKNISKKKYRDHPEDLKKLKDVLLKSWIEKIGNDDNFNNIWDVIESSSLYSFNASHAYSMSCDSLYQAWFKAHHTVTFYEVAIKHYQKKDNKTKINALIKEMIKFYGFKYGDYRFGNDNRTVNIDAINKIIYPNMSSIKSFGELVAEDLYRIGIDKNIYHSFIDVLIAIKHTRINKTVLDKLIKIDYFCEYGNMHKLLRIVELYNLLYDKKEIMKDKLALHDIPLDIVLKYGNETQKKVNKISDSMSLLEELINIIPDEEVTPEEQLKNELCIFGIVSTVIPKYSHRRFLVTEIDKKKTLSTLILYEIFSGEYRQVKIWQSQINMEMEIEIGSIIHINQLEPKNKREPTGEVDKNGKKIYRDIPDQYEYWLKSYYIVE